MFFQSILHKNTTALCNLQVCFSRRRHRQDTSKCPRRADDSRFFFSSPRPRPHPPSTRNTSHFTCAHARWCWIAIMLHQKGIQHHSRRPRFASVVCTGVPTTVLTNLSSGPVDITTEGACSRSLTSFMNFSNTSSSGGPMRSRTKCWFAGYFAPSNIFFIGTCASFTDRLLATLATHKPSFFRSRLQE